MRDQRTTHKIIIKLFAIWLLLSFCSIDSIGQNHLVIKGVATSVLEKLDIKTDSIYVSDSLAAILEISPILQTLRSNSYLEAKLVDLTTKDSTYMAEIFTGRKFSLQRIEQGNIPDELIKQSGVRLHTLKSDHYTPQKISASFERILNYVENHGYPFAQIQLSAIEFDSLGQISASIDLKKNQKITFDTIILEGDPSISKNYLKKYLAYSPSDPYDHSLIMSVETKLQEIPFIKSKKQPFIRFVNNTASLVLNLDDKNASRFDVLIGVLPNNANEDKLQISGDVSLEMYNKLKKGEHIFFEFKRLKPETQSLNLKFEYPFIFSLPFGLDSEFDLFRNENKNIDIFYDLGIQYFLKRLNAVKFFWKYESSRLLDIDTVSILQSGILPNRLDVQKNNLGVRFNYKKLDYSLNPRRGFSIELLGTAGIKNVLENNQIKDLKNNENDFINAYDSLKLVSSLYSFKSDIQYYIPIGKSFTLLLRNRNGFKSGTEQVFQNEYYRIGGNKILRGFDEQSILADFYSVFNVEYRLLLGTNSYLAAFGDYAIVRNQFDTSFKWDSPISFGAGINFETAAGIFGINLSLGKEKGNPFDYRNAKTHFGFISLF